MKIGKTELVIILDRSGSMSSIKQDMEGGLRTFLEKQKNEPGECVLSLYQFDTHLETIYEAIDLKSVNAITIEPRASTALYDAIGEVANKVGKRLAALPESERAESVIVAVITDGEENSSSVYTSEKIAEIVKHQTEKYNWKFVFLGANQDAILAGASVGIGLGNSLTYSTTSAGIANTMSVFSSGVSCMRSAATSYYSFTDSDRISAAVK